MAAVRALSAAAVGNQILTDHDRQPYTPSVVGSGANRAQFIGFDQGRLFFSLYETKTAPVSDYQTIYLGWETFEHVRVPTVAEVFGFSDEFAAAYTPVELVSDSGPWANVVHTLNSYKELAPGWNGDGSERPSDLVVGNAIEVVNSLRRQGVAVAPRPFVIEDGEVGLRWKDGDRFCSISFYPDGNIVGYATAPEWDLVEIDQPFSPGFDLGSLINYLAAL